MTDLPISLTCADYARVMPLATGAVKPEGIALTMILGSRGSWPARAEMLRRAVQDAGVQGGEWSMAQYLYRIDKGDRRYVGLPVFPLPDRRTAGEREAISAPPRPAAYHPRPGPIVRLFPDFRWIEQESFLKPGVSPPQHLIVVRREAWEANRWIARSLTDAFKAANDCFTAAQKGFPYATPWLEAELEDTVAVMGEDFHPYGLERNRAQIEAFSGEAFRLGLTSRRVTTEEYFADYLQGG